MIVLGLDTSTKTGVVILELKHGEEKINLLYKQEWNFPTLKGMPRLKAFADRLYELLDKYEPDVCIIEGYGFANKHTLVTLVEVGTVIKYTLHLYRVLILDIPPTSLKKFVSGKGNVKKDVMMLETYKRWHLEGTDNEVDAFCLAQFGLGLLGYVKVPKVNATALTEWAKKHPKDIEKLQLIANSEI